MKSYNRNINYLQKYNIDFDNLDKNKIYVGDVYKLVYTNVILGSTKLKPVMKDAILLNIGYDRYINLSKIKTKLDKEKINRVLNKSYTEKSKYIIFGQSYKPFVDEQIVSNLKSYKELHATKVKIKKKIK